MSRNEILIDASADAVFKVLATAPCYPRWVLGAKRFRGADGNFPEPGSRFHHAVGVGPFELKDHTEVVDVEPGRRIVLCARARPATEASIDLRLEARGNATNVVMYEEADKGPARLLPGQLREALLTFRNAISLMRLKRLVEQRTTN